NEELFKNNAISTSQIESSRLAFQSAEAQYIVARRQYNDTRITTPIGGIVSSRSVDFGTMVVPGTVIANVVDVSKLKVKIQLAEHDVFKIKNGDKAVVSTDVYPGMEFEARVENISAKADEAHTYPVELSLNNNSKNPLKAGMFARVDFKTFVERTSVVIAREALVGSLKKPQVFVVEGDKAVLRNIVVGVTSSHKIEVLSGLKEGENVVIKGQNNLQDQSTIRVAQ
ncbi:MAG TPA: efflux RND transporter periplasmic adaptor subunit, partial [bacterium]|nr:efflux RND transporter periplasmic adaptor subunit [bacterium]